MNYHVEISPEAQKWRIVYQIDEELQRILVLRVRLKENIDYESL